MRFHLVKSISKAVEWCNRGGKHNANKSVGQVDRGYIMYSGVFYPGDLIVDSSDGWLIVPKRTLKFVNAYLKLKCRKPKSKRKNRAQKLNGQPIG